MASWHAHVYELAIYRSRALLSRAIRDNNGVLFGAHRNAHDVARIARSWRHDKFRESGRVLVREQVGNNRRGVLRGGGRRPSRDRSLRVGGRVHDEEAAGHRVSGPHGCHSRPLPRRDRRVVLH